MTKVELMMVGLIQQTGWTVIKEFEADESFWWKAIPPAATEDSIVAMDVKQLFEKWAERDSVLEAVFKIKINKKGVEHAV